MVTKDRLIRVGPVAWEVPTTYRKKMRVPARVYAREDMLDDVLGDRSMEQLVNVAMLPGICGRALAMPDIHEGYGFPIGGVAAMDCNDGMISPGGIGYDINCGVRLLRSSLSLEETKDKLAELAEVLYRWVPSGVGQGGSLKLSPQEMDEVLTEGVRWMVRQGKAREEDLRHIESHGYLANADHSQVSDKAKKRGYDQLGTIGAGNHFAEVDVVESLFDEGAARALGLQLGQLVVLIHTGSRGLGHQVATNHIRIMVNAMQKYNIVLPDRELACTPFSSPEGQSYFNAMAAAANFAWANRQMITWEVRQAFSEVFGSAGDLELVYDVAHNIAKVEEHEIDGTRKTVVVHRKGATRSFGPGHPELAQEYRELGQPVLIPGSMGTGSYVLVGASGSMKETFGSCCHGAGRRLSRRAAKKEVDGHALKDELLAQGVHVAAGSISGLAEEAPVAYKDVDNVVDVVEQAGIARKVARLRPCVVVKG